jgi:hypothetical protein
VPPPLPPPAPTSLAAALFQHAAERPDEPWLFRAEGLDWRWCSFAAMAERVERLAADLAPEAEGAVAAARPRTAPGAQPATPEGVAWELARQAAGLPVVWRSAEGERSLAPDEVVREGEALAAALQLARMPDAAPARKARGIVVLCGPFDDPAEGALLAWATLCGAAVVLEPTPALRVPTALWARPTVFLGSPEEIAALRHRVARESSRRRFALWGRRRRALPLRRLRALLVRGAAGLPEDDAAFWRGRGVAVLAAERRNRGI